MIWQSFCVDFKIWTDSRECVNLTCSHRHRYSPQSPLPIAATDANVLELEDNSLNYVAGNVCKTVSKNHDCDLCSDMLVSKCRSKQDLPIFFQIQVVWSLFSEQPRHTVPSHFHSSSEMSDSFWWHVWTVKTEARHLRSSVFFKCRWGEENLWGCGLLWLSSRHYSESHWTVSACSAVS